MKIDDLKIAPGSKFKIRKFDTGDTLGISKAHALKAMETHGKRLAAMHNVLYAEHSRALLLVFQGMDASGKDGTISHVMSGVNPQGCSVTSFKQPSILELDHDFLWRIHNAVPPRGTIGIFNRSHYESVLIERVHNLVPKDVWSARYEQINNFEDMLAESNVVILKFFLHMGSDEQKKRFEDRLSDPMKNWKASVADYKEREYWDDYQEAYQDAVEKCSTKAAPWYVVPSDHKWFRNFAVSEIIVETLESLKMKYPRADKAELEAVRAQAAAHLSKPEIKSANASKEA